jgi:predicted nuclease of restriction endonuclease-like (RecB) superfamily
MDYSTLISAIRDAHTQALAGVVRTTNRCLILRNWLIGAYLVEFEQNGQDRAAYGARLLQRVAADLANHQIPGCAVRMLERMRVFYTTYPQLAKIISSSAMTISPALSFSSKPPKSSSAMTKSKKQDPSLPLPLPANRILALSWTLLIELIRLPDPWQRAFYENECLRGNWVVRHLQRQIGSQLYERTALSVDKQTTINRARQESTNDPFSVIELIRDPYILEFTGLPERPYHLESDLEKAILDHLQAFLLELGEGFCFEARQKRITVGNEHDYIDLVFYHRVLRCHLLIDLKARAFQHGDAGQMNFYLNYWKENQMTEGDMPPVGLILCADKDEARVQYATGGLPHELMVSRYLTALPSPETIKALIERDQALREQARLDSAP